MTSPFSGDRIILSDLGFYGYHGLFYDVAMMGKRFFFEVQ